MSEAIKGVPDRWDVSVVMSSYNRADVLPGALASLLQQQAPGVRYEIVVVDNDSTDSTRAVVESFIARGGQDLRYLFEPRQGVAYGRNTGIRASRAPIIACTDDDVTVAPDWIATVKRTPDEDPLYVYHRNWQWGLRNRLCCAAWFEVGCALVATFASLHRRSLKPWRAFLKGVREAANLAAPARSHSVQL